MGNCTSTQYVPTAQVALQQGAYLSWMFKQLMKHDTLLEQIVAAKPNTNSLWGRSQPNQVGLLAQNKSCLVHPSSLLSLNCPKG
jgi:NADH dehydrogenase FAD-containing subunit